MIANKKHAIVYKEHITPIEDKEALKDLYTKHTKTAHNWWAISNIDNRIRIDEHWLQSFRKTLDDRNINVRVICKPQWTRYEQNWLKKRELKIVSANYFLISNIDIIDTQNIIITKPWQHVLGIAINDPYVHELFLKLFSELRNNNQYMVGIKPWDDLCTEMRISIMNSWQNYGIDSVINPVLYPFIFDAIWRDENKIVDFGCWTHTMGMQLLYGIPQQVPWLKKIEHIQLLRKKIQSIVWYEANEKFVQEAISYISDMEAEQLSIVRKELIRNNSLSNSTKSIDLCLSRNFIVHLNYQDLDYHFSEAKRILKPGWTYILATLNPAYEHKKYYLLTKNALRDWERYTHYHGTSGELWQRVQYYKTKTNLDNHIKKYFTIDQVEYCMPINDDAKESHPLYYDKHCPMAMVYVLRA